MSVELPEGASPDLRNTVHMRVMVQREKGGLIALPTVARIVLTYAEHTAIEMDVLMLDVGTPLGIARRLLSSLPVTVYVMRDEQREGPFVLTDSSPLEDAYSFPAVRLSGYEHRPLMETGGSDGS